MFSSQTFGWLNKNLERTEFDNWGITVIPFLSAILEKTLAGEHTKTHSVTCKYEKLNLNVHA